MLLTKTPVARRPCVTETHVFDRIYVFLPNVVESVTGLSTLSRSTAFSWDSNYMFVVIAKNPMGLGMWNFIQRWAVSTTNYAWNYTLQIQTCQYATLHQYWCISHIFVAAMWSVNGWNCELKQITEMYSFIILINATMYNRAFMGQNTS